MLNASTVLIVLESPLTTAAYGCKAFGSGPSNIAPEKSKLYSSVHYKKKDTRLRSGLEKSVVWEK